MKSREKVYGAIIDYINEHQYPPTLREICKMTGISSTNTVHHHIERLTLEGKLESDAGMGSPRALRVPGYKFVKE